MSKIVTAEVLVLSRTNYGESDRILTVLDSSGNKFSLIAKGVRKLKSKMAGGIELFCECQISYIPGKRGMSTLVSARAGNYFGGIVKNIDRTMFGYEVIKLVNKITEDHNAEEYYLFLRIVYRALDDSSLDLNTIKVWSYFKLLEIGGHQPNFYTDVQGNKLVAGQMYDFDFSSMAMTGSPNGRYSAKDIKFLRLIEEMSTPAKLCRVVGLADLSAKLTDLMQGAIKFNL